MIARGKAMATASSHPQKEQKAMLQNAQEPAGAPPPPGFKSYTDNRASGGVLKMLTQMVEDTQAMIDESVEGETDGMKGYETYIAASNKANEARRMLILELQTEIAKKEQFVIEAQQKLNEVLGEKRRLRQYDIDLYGVEGCAYLQKNYETRHIEREEEIGSLKEAQISLGAQAQHQDLRGSDTELPVEEPPLEAEEETTPPPPE